MSSRLSTGMLAGLFKDRQPFTNIILQLFTQLSTTTPTPSSHSNVPILGPSLFLCGVHFFTAFRTQWTLSELYPPPLPSPSPSPFSSRSQQQGQGQGQRQSHLVFLDRTRTVTKCLEIREKRLLYLMQQIRAYERRIGPATTATTEAASTTTIAAAESAMTTGTTTSCTALSSRSLVDPSRSTTASTSGTEQTEAAEERVVAVVVGLHDEALRLEPSLVCMNTTRFLRDPIEQSRVLRMELQALKVDLESLHTMMML